MRKNAQRVKTLQRQLIKDVMIWLGNKDLEEVKFERPFVINLDVTSATGDDWGTEALVVTHMKNDGSVYANSDDVSDQPVAISDLSLDEIAFILDELDEGRYSTENE